MIVRNCSGGIVFTGDKVLLVCNDKQEWGFPKGAVKTSGSISGKLDFGNNPSQKIMYKSIFENENVFLSFYEFFYEDGGEIAIDKCTVTEGEAIVTSFNITMSPSQAADFSCNYQFDGNPIFRDGSEII